VHTRPIGELAEDGVMKEGTATIHTSIVREFMYIIAAQAKAALVGIERPGLIQISRLHPSSEQLVPSRFLLDDVEHMIKAAINDSQMGHNVYCEGRTVREDLRGSERGKLTDTAAVFALVIDSDPDKGMGWIPTTRVSMTVETSPGNAQYWFFLREAISPELAQKLGERIRRAVNSDHDTGNPTQPYRVAGTINYPSKSKIARGRVTVPTRLIEFDPEVLWTREQIEEAFPLPEPPKTNGSATGVTADEADIPTDTMCVIREGVEEGARSSAFWNVVKVLKQDGWTASGIVTLLENYPNGIASKYRGRLQREIERVYNKIDDKPYNKRKDPKPQPVELPFCAEGLKDMDFKPIKYIVPGIFVEGLTLLAGKPKTGKSWLLLHAAIAVARGGFTLGGIHCIEGDVLYCALEDSKRRLKSRVTKLIGAVQDWPKRLFFYCELPRLSVGGLEAIRNWILAHPEARLVIIDTLAMVRAPKQRDESTYDSDYAAVLELRNLANEFGIAIVVVHHLRKADADDAFDTISGTLGLQGAPDTIMVLKRDSGGPYTLHAKGRDLIEIEKVMEFDHGACIWRLGDDAVEVRRSAERTLILEAITEAGEPIGPNQIAAASGMRAVNIRRLLAKLVKEGVVSKAGYGKYQTPEMEAKRAAEQAEKQAEKEAAKQDARQRHKAKARARAATG
jgi:AAA domain/IclR helix-turn-helix domain